MKTLPLLLLAVLVPSSPMELQAADLLKSLGGLAPTNSAGAGALTVDEMTRGLKEALARGAKTAITNLGRTNGFLGNLEVKIPLPENLRKVESAARLAGQGQLVDDFTVSMNRAAEQAVPAGLNILAESISRMSIADAQAILQGAPDAATQYFKRTSEKTLAEAFRPIITKATDSVGVTKRYKELTGKFGGAQTLSLFGGRKDKSEGGGLDVDGYVTGRALDGLFKMIAAEEKALRANPVTRTTELLKKVFSATGK